MSGGYLDDYGYFRLHETIEAIEDLIAKNDVEQMNDWGEKIEPYSKETIGRFKEAIRALKRAYVYAQRIDWLVSGDDDEKMFHERLPEDLAKIY
jgi:hypothetical protein